MTNRSAEALERIDEIAPMDCARCGHRHRQQNRCGWVDGWDGGAPTELCYCKNLIPEYEQEG